MLFISLIDLVLLGSTSSPAAAGIAFTVDSTQDAVDANAGDGNCATDAGACTVRGALQEASSRDNQALLRSVLQQPALSQTEPCPNLGTGGPPVWGDWDCDGEISSRDNQALLRRVLEQNALSKTEPCPDIETAN